MEHLPVDYGLLKSKTNDPTLHIAPKDATVSVASFGENLVLSIIQSTSTNVHVVQAERRAIYPQYIVEFIVYEIFYLS